MNKTKSETIQFHQLSGRCACGAVSFKAVAPKTYGVCHCATCRRWTGGIWMGVVCEGNPIIEGEVKVWKSSRYARRVSCPGCGTSIMHESEKLGVVTLGQGLFDDQNGWEMVRQVCIEEKPDHYGFGDGVAFTRWGTFLGVLLGKIPR